MVMEQLEVGRVILAIKLVKSAKLIVLEVKKDC